MNRRVAGVLGLVLLLLGLASSAVAAASSPGPRLAVVKLREQEWTQLLTVGSDGGALESLYARSAWKPKRAVYAWSAPSWSPDGGRIAFTTLNEQLPEFGETGTSLAWISADGGPAKPIPGTANGFEPLFSPSGRTVAFARQREFDMPRRHHCDHLFKSIAIWLADLKTGKSRALTSWRDGVFL